MLPEVRSRSYAFKRWGTAKHRGLTYFSGMGRMFDRGSQGWSRISCQPEPREESFCGWDRESTRHCCCALTPTVRSSVSWALVWWSPKDFPTSAVLDSWPVPLRSIAGVRSMTSLMEPKVLLFALRTRISSLLIEHSIHSKGWEVNHDHSDGFSAMFRCWMEIKTAL